MTADRRDRPDAVKLTRYKAASVPVVDGAANPQGKGVVGFLEDWHLSSPRGVVAKRPGQLLADYFTSLLVLSTRFPFKPVRDCNYYLYCEQDDWSLSLVSPDEWNRSDKRRNFVGTCVLHDDATWSIDPSDNLGHPGPVTDALARFYEGFLEKLDTGQSLEDELPVFEARLPYYPRLYAAALSRSIRGSLNEGNQLAIPSARWRASVPAAFVNLLAETGEPEQDNDD